MAPNQQLRQGISRSNSKGGCKTCRLRRIRCDEFKPICNQCKKGHRDCIGYLYGMLVVASDAPTLRSGAAEQQQQLSSVLFSQVPLNIDPYIKSVIDANRAYSQILSRYYMDKVLFRRPKSTTKTSSTSRDFSAMPAHNSVMVATSLGLRIAVASHQHAIDFEPSRAYGTADLWTELFACRQFILRYINESINDINGAAIPSAVVRQICNMTTIDQEVGLSSWRTHLQGFLSITIPSGLVQKYLDSEPRMGGVIRTMIIYTVLAYSTAPPDKQMATLYALSYKSLRQAYRLGVYSSFPCPSALFMEIHTISHVRLAISGKYSYDSSTIQNTINGILNRITAFDADNWKESFRMPKCLDVPLIALLFKRAVYLYGLQTLFPLPESAIIEYEYRKEELLFLIRHMMYRRLCILALPWPLAVLGVSLRGSSKENQQVVLDGQAILEEIPMATCAVMMTTKKLKEFWASDKTTWDDCWQEAHMVI